MTFCVIGAGAAGMAAMKALAGAGIPFDCFEATDRVGGHWHTDYDCVHLGRVPTTADPMAVGS